MKKLRVGSVISIKTGDTVYYGVVTDIDTYLHYRDKNKGRRKLTVMWSIPPADLNLRYPRAFWFEKTHKDGRFQVLEW